jgi:hypothetical protein
MRRELPIAITLIAAGIALWAGKNGALHQLLPNVDHASDREKSSSDSSEISQPKFLQASNSESAHGNSRLSESFDLMLSPVSLHAGLNHPSPEARELLSRLSRELRNSRAFRLDLVAELYWQASEMMVSGHYAQRGQGTDQSRIDLKLGRGAEARSLSKICDGRFLYSLQQFQGKRKLHFVDLKRIQEQRISAGLTQPEHPTNWIAMGGLVGFLDNLSLAFQFTAPQFSQQDGIHLFQVDGIWNPDALRELLKSSVASHQLAPEIIWNKLPQNVPHQVQLIFVQHPSLGWLPQQISFFQFAAPRDGTTASGAKIVDLSLLARIKFSRPVEIDVDEADFLQLNTDDVETTDNTSLYISQVKKYEIDRQAQSATYSVIR